MSLRARQKARRAQEIIDIAATLFEERGYANTTIEDLAEAAMVAPGTVYNYFGTKDGLLRGILQAHIDARRIERERFFKNLPEDIGVALDEYLDLLLDRAFVLANREIWRQVLASSISNGGQQHDLLQEITGVLVGQFEQFFRKFVARGTLVLNAPLRELAEAAMGIADFHFYRLVRRNDLTIKSAKAKIRTQLRLLLQGVSVKQVHPQSR